MANQGRYEWERSMEERCKLTADDLIGIINEYDLYGYHIEVRDEGYMNTILFIDDRCKLRAEISYDGKDVPVAVVIYNGDGTVRTKDTKQ